LGKSKEFWEKRKGRRGEVEKLRKIALPINRKLSYKKRKPWKRCVKVQKKESSKGGKLMNLIGPKSTSCDE